MARGGCAKRKNPATQSSTRNAHVHFFIARSTASRAQLSRPRPNANSRNFSRHSKTADQNCHPCPFRLHKTRLNKKSIRPSNGSTRTHPGDRSPKANESPRPIKSVAVLMTRTPPYSGNDSISRDQSPFERRAAPSGEEEPRLNRAPRFRLARGRQPAPKKVDTERGLRGPRDRSPRTAISSLPSARGRSPPSQLRVRSPLAHRCHRFPSHVQKPPTREIIGCNSSSQNSASGPR